MQSLRATTTTTTSTSKDTPQNNLRSNNSNNNNNNNDNNASTSWSLSNLLRSHLPYSFWPNYRPLELKNQRTPFSLPPTVARGAASNIPESGDEPEDDAQLSLLPAYSQEGNKRELQSRPRPPLAVESEDFYYSNQKRVHVPDLSELRSSRHPAPNNNVELVMPLRGFRGMPGRQLLFLVVLCLLAGLGYIHLMTQISRLDSARSRLEKTVAQLQQDKLDNVQRHLASTSALEQSTSYDDDLLIIYNRVPKTGSTSFAGIAYDLCTRNRFHVLHLNITKNSHTLSLSDQMRFVYNITTWTEKKPALYHGHLAYIEFSKFGVTKKPIFINIIRKPLDRLVSYYYFVRHGDDFRPYLRRRKAGNKQTFDDCVEEGGEDCDPSNLWMQIPFFCGHAAECWMPGYRWALEQAKYNLVHNYLVVGITEELGDFIAILEATLPRFFKGAVDLYNSGRKSHLRKTSNKIPPKDSTLLKIQQSKIWKMEQEFYEFAVEQFHFIKQRTFDLVEGEYVEKGYQFVFEKIRPK